MAMGIFSMPILADRIGSVKTIVIFNGSATALIIALPLAPSFLIALAIT